MTLTPLRETNSLKEVYHGSHEYQSTSDQTDWAYLINEKSGAEAVDVVMDVAAWKVFRSDADVKDRLNVQRRLAERPSMAQDAVFRIGGNFAGAIDGFNIWVYSGRYKDDSGTLQKMLPNGTVIMVGEMLGVQTYGAILDEAAGFQALPYFSKSWIENDPPRRFVMTQSAPLLVPSNAYCERQI